MTAFLLDEMFPAGAAVMLRETYGHDAVHVAETGLRGAEDAQVAATAVLKKNLPAGGGQAAALAKILDRWAQDHPEPYLGHHWPAT